MKEEVLRVGDARLQQVFETFISRVGIAVTPAAVRDAMSDTAAYFGLRSFAYLAPPTRRATRPQIIASYPAAWVSHYLKRRYHRLDPVIAMARRRVEPFVWDDCVGANTRSGGAGDFFAEAAEFGIRCGFTFPLHSRTGGFAAVTFATDLASAEFRQILAHHGHVLELLSVLLHHYVQQRLGSPFHICGVHLTPRELECLEWAARGKSAGDTAAILGVAKSTVIFHLENAKAKLGVRTICQAVACLAGAPAPVKVAANTTSS
jgi:DNA-binding CsgD family transcriptional regulator